MKNLILTAIASFAAFLCFSGISPAAGQKEILQNPDGYPELQEYRQIFFGNLRNQEMDWPEKCRKIISEFQAFIKKHPKSEFTDEAKLRIAEFYELSFQKIKALPYLNDIIKNHPDADYFSLGETFEPGMKTAAWALYYRGLWFGGAQAIEDWKKILEKYPESGEPLELARWELKKRGIFN
ncbi:MAG: tetratricopeptide repeat protein [bacterium]|nr:tetratricopeptide repeat protein [bacterium]